MEYLIYLLSIIIIIIGIVGDVIPGIPGTPVSYFSLIILQLSKNINTSTETLVIMGVMCAVITVLDYIVPAWGTKKFGGSKAGVRGSTVGLIVSIVVLPMLGIVLGPFGIIGILAGPFVGAYIGEKMSGGDDTKAWRSAFGSFIGFLAGTFMKLAYSIIIAYMIFRDIILTFIN